MKKNRTIKNHFISKSISKHKTPYLCSIKNYETLEDSVRNTFGRVCWSHKIQECQADIYISKFKFLEIIRISLSAILSLGVFSLLFIDEYYIKIISTIISFVVLLITGYFKLINLPDIINEYKTTANKLLIIRDKLQFILMKINLKIDNIIDITSEYNEILDKLHIIYQDAPNTTEKAVEKAGKALKIKKDNDITDMEIDINLPHSLRRVP